ncbi:MULTISPECIES: hypothetical protein [unclassified Streptomyces]|uniref:hypothetical protein n=1 Tax=unclassified Streptomyces TaxID=2593676 RepID=UPI002FC2FF75
MRQRVADTQLLSGAMNEAALWIAQGGNPQAAEQALDQLLTGLRPSASGPPTAPPQSA